ncbi:MAG: lactate utilization protein [Betaproteobacteria bacterium AqS2]|uniref:Lactate utilization protein n=1 Tax=Candidatus Amphirhobacter heronislandensis TaxID=1732024 RepID=A0A930UHF8_9GAMM|nr:lactate utilization protein [Betaproteobacteria bacterium AqS2]
MATAPISFARRAAADKDGPALRQAMETAKRQLFGNADKAMAHPDYPRWRDEGTRIREEAVGRLPELLERFEERARAAGAEVHWARDAAAARRIVAAIAKKHGCRSVIKSKSMLTEEIELNDGLERAGLEVLETDLGEYVVQLSGGRPSHIIAPIIHMTAKEVNALFAAKHGGGLKDSKEAIANFLVAATGSVAIVTNEGNGRFSGARPRVRVSVAGIEKVIPGLAELGKLLRLLPRAATGQHSSAYVSLATGPGGGRHPEHHHIVLVDGGRSRLLAGKYRAMLRCIRCGSCMNHCPVYKTAGGLSYDSVYVGPMGAVLSPNLFGPRHDDLPHAATMCGACSASCPVKIPLPELMRELREDQVEAGRESRLQKLLFALWLAAATRPRLYAFGARLASAVLRLVGGRAQRLDALPGGAGWFAGRALRTPAERPFRFSSSASSRHDD